MAITNFPHGVSSFGVPVAPGMQSGVGLGDVYWVVANRTSDLYFAKLSKRVSRSNIFTTLQAAHDACTSDQGDTIFMAPGIYTSTAEIDFTKSNINVVGMDGPNTLLTYSSTRDMGGVTLDNATAGIVNTLHVSGARNKFWGLHMTNRGAATTNLSALKVGAAAANSNSAYGNYFDHCTFHGIMSTSQNTIPNCSVDIGSGASNYMFESCVIGQNTFGGSRSTGYQGHVHYGGTGDSGSGAGYGPQNGMWKNCFFLSRSTSADTDVVMIRVGSGTDGITAGEEMDRAHWWINCHFDSWGHPATDMLSVFDINMSGGPLAIKLINCSAHTYAEWRAVRGGQFVAASGVLTVNMGIPVTADPGIAIEPTS